MKLFLAKDISIFESPIVGQFGQTKFLFDSNSSIVATGTILTLPDLGELIDTTIGSEPWISEDSDFFRFDTNGNFHSAVLKLPNRNSEVKPCFRIVTMNPISLNILPCNKAFIVPPRTFRFFDPLLRKLYCFTSIEQHGQIFEFPIAIDMSLFFDENGLYFGWMLDRPLENITESFQGEYDEDSPDKFTYNLFDQYFRCFSDNQCDNFNDDMEAVTINLCHIITPNDISMAKGSLRRNLLTSSINSLRDYFID